MTLVEKLDNIFVDPFSQLLKIGVKLDESQKIDEDLVKDLKHLLDNMEKRGIVNKSSIKELLAKLLPGINKDKLEILASEILEIQNYYREILGKLPSSANKSRDVIFRRLNDVKTLPKQPVRMSELPTIQ